MHGRPAPVLKPSSAVGAPIRRLEDPGLLTGRGQYLDDWQRPDLLHVAIVRSPHAHARVLRVDASEARRRPGVAAVLTGHDLDGRVRPLLARLDAADFTPTPWPALPTARVRFAGEPVAVVAAADPYLAADAAELVAVDYEPLPAVASIDAALAAGAPRLHEGLPDNLLLERRESRGDVDGALARAAVVLRETFEHGRCSAAPLEARGLVAEWSDGRLTVWCGTQAPSLLQRALADAFGLDLAHVRVVVPDTGGGFGQKMHVLPEDVAVAALARAVAPRPAKWVESRRENLTAASQAREKRVAIEAAADASGRLLALRARLISDAGAYHVYPLTAALEPLGAASMIPGPYRTPAYAWEALAVATNKPPLGAYRGVGMAMSAFVMERVLDLLAGRLGLDPAEIRRRNLIPREAYPFTSATGLVYDSGDLPKALEMALELAGYERLRREQAEARAVGRCFGIGIACYTEYTGMGSRTYRDRGMADVPGPEAARVTLGADGRVRCALSFSSQGQGHATTVAQIVAGELGVPLDQVLVARPDTAGAPAGSGTFASRGAIAQVGTAGRAAALLRHRLLSWAARLLEASSADLELVEGRVRVRGMPDRAVTLAEIAGHAAAAPDPERALDVSERFDPPGPAFSGAVHVAAVDVDAETGRVRVRSYVVAEDCGPLINPLIVEGQIHGAVAQGLGEALGEELIFGADGQLLTGTLMDYALPTAVDVPPFTIGHLETPSPLTPGGYKGMGEGGTIGAPAAIANAVADALRPLGTRISRLPLRRSCLAAARSGQAHE
ncbi:MAG: xanthine dehydrogenase family protein molybdopterin-binding subunit [Candidatus Rokubacteria bacterium]|nr:xanthine dehydrogenase family protein molybdopterin-binding subunit [Candidatus Rokubacteria bacterium]